MCSFYATMRHQCLFKIKDKYACMKQQFAKVASDNFCLRKAGFQLCMLKLIYRKYLHYLHKCFNCCIFKSIFFNVLMPNFSRKFPKKNNQIHWELFLPPSNIFKTKSDLLLHPPSLSKPKLKFWNFCACVCGVRGWHF